MANADLERRIKAGETLRREEALEVWNDVRTGVRKNFPHNRHNSTSFLRAPEHRIWILEEFVSRFRIKNNAYPGTLDFNDAKLQGMLKHHYYGSPHAAFVGAGFTNPASPLYDAVLDKTPWLAVGMLPNRYWQIRENRAKATKWLVETLAVLGKPLSNLSGNDFKDHKLDGVLAYCNDSPISALREAGFRVLPTDMHTKPKKYWAEPTNRIRHVLTKYHELGRLPKYKELPDPLLVQAGGINAALQEAGLLNSDGSEK